MGTVLVLNGSPKKKHGFTTQVLRACEQGVKSVGGEVIWWDLNAADIRPCQGCNYCLENDGCSVQDGLAPIFQQIRDCDGFACGIPNYFFTASAQFKIFLDRMAFMHDGDTPKSRYPGKKYASFYIQGGAGVDVFKDNYDWIDEGLRGFGWDCVDQLIVEKTLEPDFKLSDEILQKAFDDGVELGKHTCPPVEEAKAFFEAHLAEMGIWDPANPTA